MNFGFHRHRAKYKLDISIKKQSQLITVFNSAAYFAGIGVALMTFPQVWKIFSEQNATGVSLFTWLMYAIGSCFWLSYGIVHKDKPIIFTNGVAVLMQFAIVLGVLLYQ